MTLNKYPATVRGMRPRPPLVLSRIALESVPDATPPQKSSVVRDAERRRLVVDDQRLQTRAGAAAVGTASTWIAKEWRAGRAWRGVGSVASERSEARELHIRRDAGEEALSFFQSAMVSAEDAMTKAEDETAARKRK